MAMIFVKNILPNQLNSDTIKANIFLDEVTMELEGQIEEFIYQNEANDYSIAIFSCGDNEIITVVGYLPFVAVGDCLKLHGKMVVHQEYGEQFKIDTFEKAIPQTADALGKYLASRDHKRNWSSNS